MSLGLGSLIVLSLATYRAASIIAQEGIFEPLRNWLVREWQQGDQDRNRQWSEIPQPRRWLGQLISCVFCVSVWAGWILLAAWLYGGIVGQVFVGGLAASGGAISLGTWLANNAKRGATK